MTFQNHFTIIGNVGQAPEGSSKTRDGKSVVNFSVGQSVSAIDRETGAWVKRDTQWFRVACFANLAEKVQLSLRKGDLVLVSGEFRTQKFQSLTGKNRITFEINAREVYRVSYLPNSKCIAEERKTPNDNSPNAKTFDNWNEEELRG